MIQHRGPVERIDWFRVIVDLDRRGWRAFRVGYEIGVSKSTILSWKQGGEPRHSDGERLLKLWALVTCCPRESVPILDERSGFRPGRLRTLRADPSPQT